MSEEILFARVVLNRMAEPACIPLWDLVRTHGPVDALERIRSGAEDDVLLQNCRHRLDAIDPGADLEVADRHGIRLVVPESHEWPHFAFSALERTGLDRAALFRSGQRTHSESGEPIPPLALWVRGSAALETIGTRSVGIVGARAATDYGIRVSTDLAYGLARRGFVVVSGGAYGIDAAAHRGALSGGGQTVVVSAGGLDRAYPPSNAGLFEQAAQNGLVVSESPPGSAPRRRRFITRNRIIAALSTGSVVVEAAHRSGAMNTASHCTRIGRPVMVVPGPVTSAMSVGCHVLLTDERAQNILVTGVDDIVAVIGSSTDLPPEITPRAEGLAAVTALLDSVEVTARRVFDGLPAARPVQVDELALLTDLSPIDVIRSLPALELAGLIETGIEGIRVAPALSSARRQRPPGGGREDLRRR